MSSPHLAAERDRLLSEVVRIRDSGAVAAANCWITESSQTKGNKTYTYARLVSELPGKKPEVRSLGRPGSRKHREATLAIQRRDAIAELEQQLSMLEALLSRQAARSIPQVESFAEVA